MNRSDLKWLAVLFPIEVAAALFVILHPNLGLPAITPPAAGVVANVSEVVSQLESGVASLHGIAIGLFVVIGFRFKDAARKKPVLHPIELFLLGTFLAAELMNAYYGYYVRLALVENLSVSSLTAYAVKYAILDLVRYQAYAVLVAALASGSIFCIGLIEA